MAGRQDSRKGRREVIMDISTGTISNTLGKEEADEAMSLSAAALEDAAKRLAEGSRQKAISNETIRKDNEILDTYRVISDAVEGGMGNVWCVHHKSWDTDLAMKRPKPEFFAEGGRQRKQAFIEECENWIDLGLHPNIVSCYYVREIGGVPTIFSEWMDGGSLKDRIRDASLYEGTTEEIRERILDIAIQAARGLLYSHEKGLVHQDVKPGNLLLTRTWEAKAADFGLAKAQSRLSVGERAVSGGYTKEYCPREQAEGAPAERWMDVYAWALTVLEMYAGRRFWSVGADAFSMAFGNEPSPGPQYRIDPPERLLEVFRDDYGAGSENWRDFSFYEQLLTEIYLGETGRDYPRTVSRAAADTGSSLNNKALSFLDLGMSGEAEKCWNEALKADPVHLEACVNEGLFLWRNARINDLEMAERIWYFGPMLKSMGKDSSTRRRYVEMRDEFFLEAGDGIDHIFPFRGRVDNYTNLVTGRGTRPGGKIIRAYVEGDCICFDFEGEDDSASGCRTFAYDILTGEAAGQQCLCPDAKPGGEEQAVGENVYLFCMKETEPVLDDSRMILEIREQGSGRVKRTVGIQAWNYYEDREGRLQRVYPLLITDYTGHRLIFVSQERPEWAVYEMPAPSEKPSVMAYRLTRPIPFRERREEETIREKCAADFLKARQSGDFVKMNDAYQRTWELPLTGETGIREQMNEELMKMCRLPGVYYPAPGIELRITGHDPADPLPAGLFRVLPSSSEPGEDRRPFEGQDEFPAGCAFRDAADETAYYYPVAEEGGRPRSIAACIWDKKEKKVYERIIRPELEDQYISRVAAVSSEGHFLIAELRPLPEETGERENDFNIACISCNGRWKADIYSSSGNVSLKALFLEDGRNGPNRGLLFLPGTRHLIYFEQNGDSFYAEENLRWFRHSPYAFPVPDEVFPEESYERPVRESRDTIESVTVSADGENVAMVILEGQERRRQAEETRRTLYIRRGADQTWDCYPFGSVSAIFLTRDFHYIITGKKTVVGQSYWSWEFFPGIMEQKQMPLYELREFSSESRIASISYDLCSLLDARGRPVYHVYWRYAEGEDGHQ